MVTVCSWARPCSIPVMFSDRVSFHRTGRPVCRASQQTSANSGSAPIFAPNPPPTSGVIRCTAEASTPSQPATSSRAMCAFCVEAQRVNRSSEPHTADAARVSSGHAANRWLTISWVTTTAQSSNRCSSNSSSRPKPLEVLVPASSNSSTSSEAAARRSTTAGSGS